MVLGIALFTSALQNLEPKMVRLQLKPEPPSGRPGAYRNLSTNGTISTNLPCENGIIVLTLTRHIIRNHSFSHIFLFSKLNWEMVKYLWNNKEIIVLRSVWIFVFFLLNLCHGGVDHFLQVFRKLDFIVFIVFVFGFTNISEDFLSG